MLICRDCELVFDKPMISVGTSSIVTALSTYLSGGSVVVNAASDVAVIAETHSIVGFYVVIADPFSAGIALMGFMDVGASAMRTDLKRFIGRRIQTVPLNGDHRLVKHQLTVATDQHSEAPSFSLR